MAVLAVLVAAVPSARATTIDGCLARKLKMVGRAAAAAVTCHAREAVHPNPALLAVCSARAERRFSGGDDPSKGQFARLEDRLQCLTSDDQGALASDIALYAAQLDAQVANPGTPNMCDAAKLTCLGRYVTGVTECLSRAATTGVIDVGCLGNQTSRLLDDTRGCLHQADTRALCSVTGDDATLAAAADQFAADTLCALDPSGMQGCPSLPTPVPTPSRTTTPLPTRTPTPVPTGGANDLAQSCVDAINSYRASIGRPPYARWTAAETCVNGQGLADSQSNVPHSAFGRCGEYAQNECPGWPGPPANMIGGCLQAMWNEGPGQDFSTHGHYINMASTNYSKVACGFAVLPDGRVWAVQDFQ